MNSINEYFTNLTWDDLRQWAGTKFLNRGKTYMKNVYDLARTESGGLIAWVSGSEDYATNVEVDEDGELDWFCTCPFDWGGPCKHSVALILKALELEKAGREIPLADKEEDLYLALLDDLDDDDDFWDDDEAEETANHDSIRKNHALPEILQKKTKKELVDLLVDLAGRYPEVKRKILDADYLQRGNIKKLASALRREIKEVTSEDAWYNPWKDEETGLTIHTSRSSLQPF
ncbi:MAG: SWIM zinc finger family protein [Desulfobulbaceae bacterium]|nr:SWIM zinc finger family protein [Desulfobulbaceae bacterium]